MKKCVGKIELRGRSLNYYVYGSRDTGFGIEITETYVEKADGIVSQSLDKALNLAQTLQKCSVFPTNLQEIIEDLRTAEDNG